MAQRFVYGECIKDTYINGTVTTNNYGNDGNLRVGTLSAEELRTILQYKTPIIPPGAVIITKEAKFTGSYTPGSLYVKYHKLNDNREEWKEGAGTSGGPSNESTNWDDWLPSTPWVDPGGDFDIDDPLAFLDIPSLSPDTTYYVEMPDLPDQSKEIEGIVLVPVWEGAPPGTDALIHRSSTYPTLDFRPYLRYMIEDPNWFIDCTIQNVSSRYVDILWTPKTIEQVPDFKQYTIEQSPDGIGSWTPVGTETDIAVGLIQFEIVPVGDVDFYNHNLDTWPQGRTLFFRVSIEAEVSFIGSSLDQSIFSPVVEHTSIRAPRSMSYANTAGVRTNQTLDSMIIDKSNYSLYDSVHGKTIELFLTWFEEGQETDFATIDNLGYLLITAGISGWTVPAVLPFTTPVQNSNFDLNNIILPTNQLITIANWSAGIITQINEINGHTRTVTYTGSIADFLYARFPTFPTAILKGGGGTYETGDTVDFDARYSSSPQSLNSYVGQAVASDWTALGPLTPTFNPALDLISYPIGITPPSFIRADALPNEFGAGNTRSIIVKGYYDFISAPLSPWFAGVFLSVTDGMTAFPDGYFVSISGGSGSVNIVIWRLGVNVATTSVVRRAGFIGFEVSREEKIGSCDITVMMGFSATKDAIMDEYVVTYTDPSPLPGGIVTVVGNSNFLPNDIYHVRIWGKPTGMDTRQDQGIKLVPDIGNETDRNSVAFPVPFIVDAEPDQISSVVTITPDFIDKRFDPNQYIETQQITVNNAIPVAVLFNVSAAYTTKNVSFNGTQSFDPEGGLLIYEYDFGDGSPILTSPNSIETHVYSVNGSYIARLRVQDEIGQWSLWTDKPITIIAFSDEIIPLTFISLAPFQSVKPKRESGLKKTPIVGISQYYLQNQKATGKIFSVVGVTMQCDNSKSREELIAETKSELDALDFHDKEGTIVEITFPFYGIIRGIISGLVANPRTENIEIGDWTFEFVEVDEFSLGEIL